MFKPLKIKQLILFGGDVIILYLSLFLTLFIRYGEVTDTLRQIHFGPFTVIFTVWLIVFYIIGFYEIKELKNNAEFGKKFGLTLSINFLLAIAFFYFIPTFGITPKTNLFIFLLLFGSAAYGWRTTYNNLINAAGPTKKMLIIGYNQVAQEIADHINANPQLGYEIKFWIKEGLQDKNFVNLSHIIKVNKISTIVVPAHIKKSSRAAKLIYKNLIFGIEVLDLASLYENLFQKVPLAELEEVWFLENLAKSRKIHDAIKQPLEIIIAILVAIIALPLAALIALLIKLNSAGSAFFAQTRVGENEENFVLWKFRTMISDAEKHGPRWAKPNDSRVTPLGKILRRSHLDELPQLLNIIRGDLSLVGPRPERPEFVKPLSEKIPYYDLRHLIKPGLTGWAQINYRYGSSLEDAYEKLQYDIYYLKNRSLWLDIIILLKTIKRFFLPAD